MKPIPDLPGVFVAAISANFTKAYLRVDYYFPSTLAASTYLGHETDVVGEALRTSVDPGITRVDGVYFVTANQLYQRWSKSGWDHGADLLCERFPLLCYG